MPGPHFTKAPPVPHKSDHNSKQTNLQSKARAATKRKKSPSIHCHALPSIIPSIQEQLAHHRTRNQAAPFDTLTMLAPPLLCPDRERTIAAIL
ncbi:hypothetical protein M0R45_030709 [Rubus argutus]|uniref:Uncharacterized protein n=1 Tax=Rubus argutus TaxID=59490 RepID=A0AAW1WE02_RUBAR